uniref:NSFL1 cofactor p47 n=1 Tax=Plectus sambesii TaxID=2011161 RepID=A0A914WP68_9BILA
MSKKFATLNSLNAGKDSGDESEEDERKKGQNFFVGGSERSGQEVVGPPRRDPDEDMTNKLFEAARAHGAEPVASDSVGSSMNARGSVVHFHGGGYRLGDTVVPSAKVDGNAASAATDDEPPQQNVTLMMWQDGFSIDEGPLRRFDDPANRAFLENIMQGQIPLELVRMYPGQEIDLKIERKSQPYKAPKPKPFSGGGLRLGGLVPQVVDSNPPPAAAAAASSAVNESAVTEAQSAVELKDGEPVTQLQIRLQSGQRLVGKFNHSHTIADVRSFIVAARPELAYQPFQLMTNFPNKVIEDESQTLTAAGLINAVVSLKSV